MHNLSGIAILILLDNMSWENVKIKGTLLFEFLEYEDFPGGLDNKGVYLQCRRSGFDPWIRKTPWRREWQCTPVFLLGEFHEQRSLVDNSPWGRKESEMTEKLSLSEQVKSFARKISFDRWETASGKLSNPWRETIR